MSDFDDTKITIPFPRSTQNINRGYFTTGAPKTNPVSVRFTDDDRFNIEAAAREIGVSFGEFIRWCAFYSAIEVKNELHRRSFEKAKGIKPAPDYSDFK